MQLKSFTDSDSTVVPNEGRTGSEHVWRKQIADITMQDLAKLGFQ